MALHGTIEVNGVTIGGWEARRSYQVNHEDSDQGPSYIYVAEVTVHGKTWRGEVVHWYNDGPVRLATRVLFAAMRDLPTGPGPALKDS